MRLLRISLKNYRGVELSEIEFGATGLTIVEGPNEVGKTSHVEAVSLLFDYMDSSTCSQIKAIKPIARDVGAEIVLEAESGPYKFRYKKRFHRKQETILEIMKPKIDTFTGRDAHERAKEILDETIDVPLWKALCIQQGEAIDQADLSKQTSLSNALDIVAARQEKGLEKEGLLDRVRQEYERYFTAGGKQKKDLEETGKEQRRAENEVEELESWIRGLESFAERVSCTDTQHRSLKKQKESLERDIADHEKSLKDITRLEAEVKTARLNLELLEKSEESLRGNLQERRDCIKSIAKIKKDFEELSTRGKDLTRQLGGLEVDKNKIKSEKTEIKDKLIEGELLLKLCSEDFDCLSKKHRLDDLKSRKERIDKARAEGVRSSEILCENQVDDSALNRIEKANSLYVEEKTISELDLPELALTGLADLDIEIDEKPTRISKDESFRLTVGDRACVVLKGSLKMEITAGRSASEQARALEEAEETLNDVCREVDVVNIKEAREFRHQRQQAETTIARIKEIEESILDDTTYEELKGKIAQAVSDIAGYLKRRKSEIDLVDSIEVAEDELSHAKVVRSELKNSFDKISEELDKHFTRCNELESQRKDVRLRRSFKGETIKEEGDKLARFQHEQSDEDLESAIAAAVKAVQCEKGEVAAINENLDARQPDEARLKLKTAQDSLELMGEKIQELINENTEARAYIKVRGEDGLQEKLDAVKSRLDHIVQENEAANRRAQAARILYEVINEERETLRRSYIRPLKKQIERLGRLVFNESFDVELNDDLTISSRIMDGCNVPFESLSGGAKEQISMVSRLSCAMLVSKQGMGSLILDDALGYTDDARLKSMGVALASAGEECQIIILTCMPERYNNIGKAKMVRLNKTKR